MRAHTDGEMDGQTDRRTLPSALSPCFAKAMWSIKIGIWICPPINGRARFSLLEHSPSTCARFLQKENTPQLWASPSAQAIRVMLDHWVTYSYVHIFQGIGNSFQGGANAILFCFMTKRIRRRLGLGFESGCHVLCTPFSDCLIKRGYKNLESPQWQEADSLSASIMCYRTFWQLGEWYRKVDTVSGVW